MRAVVRAAAGAALAAAMVLGWASPTVSSRVDAGAITTARAEQVLTAATVEIQAFGCDLQRRDGTGVAVEGGMLLTNRHVVDGSRLVDVDADRRPTTQTGPPSVAVAGDVAEIEVPELGLAGLGLSPSDPSAGSAVWIAGFPSQQPGLTIGRETVVGYLGGAPFGQPWPVMKLSGAVQQGMSGGPVLDGTGHLAGIVFGDEVPTGQALVVPASALRSLIRASAFVVSRC